MSESVSGTLLLPEGPVPGTIRFGRTITAIERGGDVPDRIIAPGFIDAHVHGGGGGDTMDGPGGVRTLAAFHSSRGTTTILPTTITNPFADVIRVLEGVRAVRADGDPALPDIPGAHLEGPFISRERLGAQPDFALPPEPELISRVLETQAVSVVTIAPELPGAEAAARRFAEAGVRVSFGHSADDGSATRRLLQAVRAAGGSAGFTHLFNAMGGISARVPGVAGTALTDRGSWAEVIFDGHHLHADVLRLAQAAKPGKLLFVTDAMRASGLGDGPTELGGQPVTVTDGRAQLEDGTLAGSVLTMDAAFRNARAAGFSWQETVRLTSTNAAAYLGLSDRGSLRAGLRADLVVLDGNLQVTDVRVAGRSLQSRTARGD
ncbi:MAG TPA: N-acetylglucosamine-6-phosphate deacetylase [Deinococcales bacterium]|nr:N-acetylglucosamine-6-phosphate deacetylase [Deinococcales bacterium]